VASSTAQAAPLQDQGQTGATGTTLSAGAAELVDDNDAPRAKVRALLSARQAVFVVVGVVVFGGGAFALLRGGGGGGAGGRGAVPQPAADAARASAASSSADLADEPPPSTRRADLGGAQQDAAAHAAHRADLGPTPAAARTHRITVRSADLPFACLLRGPRIMQASATTPCRFSAPHGALVTLKLAAPGRMPMLRRLRVAADLDLRIALEPAPSRSRMPRLRTPDPPALKRRQPPAKKSDWDIF
jgi:hypothetical protein